MIHLQLLARFFTKILDNLKIIKVIMTKLKKNNMPKNIVVFLIK